MIVQTNYGEIKGFENGPSLGGRKYFSFLGVPYAKPPFDDLRFSAPLPLDKWEGVYDATYERSCCYQLRMFLIKTMVGSEDCLYLNIHVPEINPESLKPVMFFIHGGGFFSGSGNEDVHGAKYLMDHDVILVTINYRLHVFGFLNLQIPECPGNAGLKDQLAALKWVKENIKAFGGDPDNITIDGCSAGATSVNFLMISPLAKGLFHKAIAQSGTSTSPWSITQDPVKWAFEIGRKLGYKGEDRLELLHHLRAASDIQLTLAFLQIQFKENIRDYPWKTMYVTFSPSVEEIKEGAFLPDTPENLSKLATPVPYIVGHNEMEVLFLGKHIMNNISCPDESMIPEMIKGHFKVTDDQLPEISKQVCEFYFTQNPNKSDLEKIYEFISDLITLHFYDSFEFVTTSKTPAYVYHFTYYSNDSQLRKLLPDIIPYLEKAHHAEEQMYVLSPTVLGEHYRMLDADEKVRKNMCQLWVNFIKTGDPSSENMNVKWKPSTKEEPCYLQIDAELELKDGKINQKRIDFLKNIFRDIELIE